MSKDKDNKLKEIKDKVLKCKKCSLYKNRNYPVIGQGSHDAEIMFIGEAPGAQEDKTGHPFCGRAGTILDELLNSVSIKRKDIYICNILKCRPPSNRDPEIKEIKACTPYLEKQIEIIKPKIICSLGRYSMEFLMKKFGLEDKIELISKIHGNLFEIKIGSQKLKFVAFYHPAVATYNPNMKESLKKDFQILKKLNNK